MEDIVKRLERIVTIFGNAWFVIVIVLFIICTLILGEKLDLVKIMELAALIAALITILMM